MRVFRESFTAISKFILFSLDFIKESDISKFIETLYSAYKDGKKVLIIGAGRSGLVGKAFAMRLMHLGFSVYVLGETIVPALNPGDIVIAISGSGRTKLVVTAAEVSKSIGARVIAVTSFRNSPLAQISDLVIEVPGRTKISSEDDYNVRQLIGIYEPLAPLGTLFEVTTMVTLDAIISELMTRLGKTEEDLRQRHANIEI
ncbi:MAG: 6-phospho-3-hexuloisomerase [Desulfurococcales archaeon]|nr:6-phospho-3-hexuloisomerase [Desulfurococcales archaeon]MCD6278847.1 6-phospho-3-hexuloisomerase [Desulfurococcales archaeon]